MEKGKIKKMIKTKNNKDMKTQIDTIKTTGIILMMVLVAVIVGAMFIFSNVYTTRTNSEVETITTTRISNTSKEIKKSVEVHIEERYELLKAYTASLEQDDLFVDGNKEQTNTNIQNTLNQYSELYSGFEKIKIIRKSDFDKIDESSAYNSLDDFKSYIAYFNDGKEEKDRKENFDFYYEPSTKYIYFGYTYTFTHDNDIAGIIGSAKIDTIIETLKTDVYDSVNALALIDTNPNASSDVVAYYDNYYMSDKTLKFTNFCDMIVSFSQDEGMSDDKIRDEIYSQEGSSIVYLKDSNNAYGETQVCFISDYIQYSSSSSNTLRLKMALIVPQSKLAYQISSMYKASFYIVAGVLTISGISIGLLILAICKVAIGQKRESAYDKNTGLLNLNSFKRDASIIIRQNPECKFALVYITIIKYHFLRQIYDAEYIDGLIEAVGKEIKANFPNALNGNAERNTFIIMFNYEEKKEIIDKITAFQNYMNVFKFKDINGVELSYGIKRTSLEEFVSMDKEVEGAMLASKNIQYDYTKVNYGFYNAELDRVEKNNAEVELKGQQALKDGRFEVFYQLKRDISNESWVGAEALVRWRDEDGKLISPGLFIPIFEENGFVVQIDTFVFECVCKQLRQMISEGEKVVPISINLSKKHFRDLTFINVYEDIVTEYNIPHDLIEFEITEGLLFENINVFKRFIGIAHSRGYKCSMDDFGSGYSSLNIISELDFDTIKIDQRFFRNSSGFTEESKIIISSIISLCHKLGKKVIAEGAEQFEQVKFLKDNNCDIIQSYYYSKPIPFNEYKEKLNSEK